MQDAEKAKGGPILGRSQGEGGFSKSEDTSDRLEQKERAAAPMEEEAAGEPDADASVTERMFDDAPSGPPAAPRRPAQVSAPKAADSKAEAPKKKAFGLADLVDKLVKAVTPGGKKISGRVLRQHGSRLDIEIVLSEQLDWTPAKSAVIELADGTTVRAEVNFSFTTSSGVYGPGLVLTLTLTTPAEVQQPARVHLVSAGVNLEVELTTR